MKLFDSTVLIAHLRGVPAATELILQAVGEDEAACSVLSRVEIEGGMRSAERTAVSRLFTALRLEPVTDLIARRAGEHLRAHPGIDVVDYVIAATAEVHGAQLLTLNVKHFPMVRGLAPAFR
ncbi:MAG TPA: type II toxin-antitoxin system VapC family toxin [Candidatus Dormibacteraeota bacterium]